MAQQISSGPFSPPGRAWASNQTTASFTAEPALATLPSTAADTQDGFFVFPPGNYLQKPPLNLLVLPFGTGSATNAFDVRVVLYHLTKGTSPIYVPSVACQFTATLGAGVGLAGGTVLNTEKFAESVSDPAVGTKNIDCVLFGSLASGGMSAGYLVNLKAAHAALIRISKGTATAGNALVGCVSRE